MPHLTSRQYLVSYCILAAFLATSAMLWHRSCRDLTRHIAQTQVQRPRSGNCTEGPCVLNQTQWRKSSRRKDAAGDGHNALEDAMLQTYLLAEKDNLKIKGVITFLAYLPRYDTLRKSLEHFYKNFNHHFAYPVVIFHEADFLPKIKDLQEVGFNRKRKMSSVFFQQIDMSVPDWFIQKFGQPPKDVCGTVQHIGYRSMCRFQAKLVYEQPIMRHFDYHWRLDDDSQITAKISFDVFAVLKNGGFSYGYYGTIIDTCAQNTFSVTAEYMKPRNIVPTFFHRLKKEEVFFNNFEVSNLKIWRSKQFRDYIDYMDSLGGFYTKRWGDAPVKTLFLSMFVPIREIYQFSNVSYSHHTLGSGYMTKFLS